MRKITTLLLLLCGLVAGQTGSASAVINGTPDFSHPYVGLVLLDYGACSGTAISPTVVITAAHCFLDADGELAAREVQVSFDQNARPDNLDAEFVSGTGYPNPEFDLIFGPGGLQANFLEEPDVAVIILDEAVKLPSYAQLPSAGLIDRLTQKTRVELVGYGLRTKLNKSTGEVYLRYHAPADLILSRNVVSETYVKTTANPAMGKGGTCYGDSGGPVLLGRTILAITSFGVDLQCAGPGYYYRLDTSEALNFIRSVITAHG